jgi:hypothetical protein
LLNCRSLTVFPLFAERESSLDYQLADEAIACGSAAVQETSEGGSVPELLVENRGDTRVLFLEGEELRGAKQNRILNTSIMVAARSRTHVPVSCVEEGRWQHTSKHFAAGNVRSPHGLHYCLKSSVNASLKRQAGHRSDQSAVWHEVEKKQLAFGFQSPTMALADTYTNLADQMAEYRKLLRFPEGAAGVAVAVGPKVVCVDVFDKPATCQKAWDRLLSGFIVDALQGTTAECPVDAKAVEHLLTESQASAWTEAPAIGEGQEYRAEFTGNVGSVLLLNETVVHANLLTAP